jgi:hypothetical protein
MEALRGDRSRRPRTDVTSAPGLRAMLEDGIFDFWTSAPATPVIVRASSLCNANASTDIALSNHARLRGVLINQLVRLFSVGATITSAFDDAFRAWRLEVNGGELYEYAQRLDGDDLARLATDVTSHYVTLSRALGTIPAQFQPRSAVRASVMLSGGTILLRDVIDLMVGTTLGEVANVALFDVTTSPLGAGAERSMRYHALVQTLRSGVVPLRTSVFSSATGEMWTLDVDAELLRRSVDDVLDTIRAMVQHA